MLNVQTLTSYLVPKLHGATVNKIGDPLGTLHQAASIMLGRIDPPDTIQKCRIDRAIYDRVFNYTCATDLKGTDRIIDVRPIGPRYRRDDIMQTGMRDFDIRKERNTLTVETISGIKTLRVSKAVKPGTLLTDLDAVDSTITASGDVQTVVADTLDFVTGSASLSFGLSGVTGQGVIRIDLPSQFDLSNMINLGSLFYWLKFPDSTRFTSVKLKWGSSASKYWYTTVTVPQGRTAIDTDAWDLFRYDWNTASSSGSPGTSDSAAVNYLEITINYTIGTALSSVKLDSILAALGEAYEMVYYSSFIFKTLATGVLKEIPTKDDDIITLDPRATQILLLEWQKIVSQELKGKNAVTDMAAIRYELEGDGRLMRGRLVANRQGLYRDYTDENPSQAIPLQTNYYDFENLDGLQGGDDLDNFKNVA